MTQWRGGGGEGAGSGVSAISVFLESLAFERFHEAVMIFMMLMKNCLILVILFKILSFLI